MSSLMNQARARVPRFAEAAVERARLTVVPRTATTRAARVPFVALVSLLLVGGVAGLLFFNTTMQQVSFTATRMQARATALTAQQQGLQMDLDALRNPQRVATEAKALGMVPQTSPAFIRLGTGQVLGAPAPATSANAIRINPLPTKRPRNLNPQPKVIEMAPGSQPADGKNPIIGGAAGESGAATTGTKKTQNR